MYVMNRAMRQDAQIYTVETYPAFFDDISNEKTKVTCDPQYSSNYFEALSPPSRIRMFSTPLSV
jgi:hypothetical protein